MNRAETTLRAYLVDDELLALKRLATLLKAHRTVEVVGSSTDPNAALSFLRQESVDLLFLDIQMPGMNGFELLANLPTQPIVIFTTAHDRYALEAFDVNSVAYLLKPIDVGQLERALKKVEMLRDSGKSLELRAQLQAAAKHLAESLSNSSREFSDRICSRIGDRIQFIELDKITHFLVEDKLTYAATEERKYIVDHSITELEQKLDTKGFARIHRATLVNLRLVDELHRWFGGRMLVRLKTRKRTELTVARDQVKRLKERLGLR